MIVQNLEAWTRQSSYQRIKARDGCVVDINYICEDFHEKAQAANRIITPMKFQNRKEINEFHMKLGHQLEAITRAIGKAINLKVTVMFKKCKIVLQAKLKMLG